MNKILMWILIILGICGVVFAGIVVYEISNSSNMVLEKPAIYLYPEEDSTILVKLNINGIITKTIPKYDSGWSVFVTTKGVINNQYDYLFYEADVKSLKLPKSGWIVKYSDLDSWFENNLPKLGLNEKEKNQFKDYWLERLPETNYYEIKILEDNFLKQNMDLLINPEPDTLIRLDFYFKPVMEKTEILEPIIVTPERNGFTVVEWGGVLDN